MITIVPLGLSYLLVIWGPYNLSFNMWAILASVYLFLAFTYQYLNFRSLKLFFTEDFLVKKQGVWNKREEQIETFKLQAITIKQPLWYKNRKLVNILLHTGGGDVSFKAVSREIYTYLNFVLFKVESSRKRWM